MLRSAGSTTRVLGTSSAPFEPERFRHEQAALRGAVLAWMGAGDFDRAQRFHVELGRRPVHRAEYLGLGTVLAGRRGDYEKVHRLLEEARASGNFGWEDEVAAFWLCVQGRYPEAAVALERAGPLPERYGGPLGASLLDGRQLLPAALRIYRATGRGAEAVAMAAKYLAMLRDQPGIDLAALAANEGLKDVAVETLRDFVRIDPMRRNKEKMDQNGQALESEKERFATWQARKRIDERRLFDAVAPFVDENPITREGPAPES